MSQAMRAAMRFLFNVLVKDVWVVTAVQLESGTGRTRTWRPRLSLSQSSWEAEVHQLVFVSARCSCLTSRQQHKKGQNFGLTTEP